MVNFPNDMNFQSWNFIATLICYVMAIKTFHWVIRGISGVNCKCITSALVQLHGMSCSMWWKIFFNLIPCSWGRKNNLETCIKMTFWFCQVSLTRCSSILLLLLLYNMILTIWRLFTFIVVMNKIHAQFKGT